MDERGGRGNRRREKKKFNTGCFGSFLVIRKARGRVCSLAALCIVPSCVITHLDAGGEGGRGGDGEHCSLFFVCLVVVVWV